MKSMFPIPESIDKYQDAITKTNSRIHYVVAVGLYMILSDLVLKVGKLVSYKNNIVVATSEMEKEKNEQVNTIQVLDIVKKLPENVQVEPSPPQSVEVSPVHVSLDISVLISFVYYVTTSK